MKKIAVLLLLSLCSCSWTPEEKALQATYTVLHVADWGQTRYIAEHPDEHYEYNPLIGKHPSKSKVDAYMLASLIGHYAVVSVLPDPYRHWFQVGTLAIKTGLVGHNISAGIGFEF
jgi:hypothetical protein